MNTAPMTFPNTAVLRPLAVLGWALIALLALWFTPVARAADDWMPVRGLVTGGSALAFNPSAPDTVYASTSQSLFKSTNGGTSWATATPEIAPGVAWATTIAIEPTAQGPIYAGTRGYGIFKSMDGGSSWTEVNNGLNNLHIQALALDPTTLGTIFAGTSDGVFKTTNGGAT